MIVILTKDVKGLGRAGEVVKVSDGHGRNMLLPKGLAVEATDGNIRSLEKQQKISEEKRKKDLAEAEKLAEKIAKIKVVIGSKAGEGGRLFGAVTSKDIGEALKDQHKIDVDKRKIVLENPIKHVGEVSIDIKLYPEVVAKLNVIIEG